MQCKTLTRFIIGINSLLICGGAVAQAPAGSRATTLEEVVVTARKREETVQSVPLAISAMTGEMIARNNVTDVETLTTQVPALTISPSNGSGRATPTFTIRSQRQQEISINADPSVGVYFGDIAVVRAHGVNQALYDLQSVEVLKGPQGTLFGRNTTGGAVLFKPNLPSNQFEGSVQFGVGNYDAYSTEVMVNTPLTDTLSLRLAGRTENRDGYVTDVVTGDDVDYQKNKSWRVSLLFTPTDNLESLFIYNRSLDDSGGNGTTIKTLTTSSGALASGGTLTALGYTGALSPQAMYAAQQERSFWKTASGLKGFTRLNVWDAANTTTYNFTDNLAVKNIIGYRSVRAHLLEDTDGLPVPLIQIERDVPSMTSFSEELQIIGDTDNLDWIAGLYYYREEGEERNSSNTLAAAANAAIPPSQTTNWSLTNIIGENTSKSVFAQGTYDFGDWVEGLSLTVGARYTEDDRELISRHRTRTACRIAPLTLAECSITGKADFNKVTWNITADYQLTHDKLIYLATRRGYRAGGLSGRIAAASQASDAFEPEVVDDFEFGFKADWSFAGMSARTNLALFYSENTDTQRLNNLTVTLPGGGTQLVTVTDNATIENKGGELEVTFLPYTGVELSGFWAVSFPEFTKYDSQLTTINKDNATFGMAPQHTGSFTARYTLPLAPSVGEVSLQANYYWTDSVDWTDTPDRNAKTDSYGLVNLRADWKDIMGTSFDFGMYVKNLNNEEYYQPQLALASLSFSSYVPGDPRTFGAEVKYRFGALGSH